MEDSNIFYTESLHIFTFWVHYNPDSIADILEFKSISDFPLENITIDTSKTRYMIVPLESKSYKFREFALGLYDYDNENT